MTYTSYAQLAAVEVEGVDYTRGAGLVPGAPWAVIAVHGGSIEPGTGDLCRAVAAAGRCSWYEFAGIKPSGNSSLHITSTLFDEPMALGLVSGSLRVLSVHGYTGTAGVAETMVGGRDAESAARVAAALTAAGFVAVAGSEDLDGDDPANVANRCLTGAGVQLEVSRAQRQEWYPGGDTSRAVRESGVRTEAYARYASAVTGALLAGRVDPAELAHALTHPGLAAAVTGLVAVGANIAEDT